MDYCGEFMYEDNELVCIFAPFGRMRPMKTDQGTQWRTYYSLTDHLGNVRAEFAAHDSGQPELVQQADYYPFGYTLRREDYGSQLPNRRLFGGKEVQDETLAGNTLDWYDFEARMYDPLIGRFHTTDPMAAKYYSITPYGYCVNNPMRFTDPSGMDTLVFSHTGYYEKKLPGGNNVGMIRGKDGKYATKFEFADERWCDRFVACSNDDMLEKNLGREKDELFYNKIVFVNDQKIESILEEIDFSALQSQSLFDKINYIKEQSRGGNKDLDFVNYPTVQSINPYALILTSSRGEFMAHDKFNFGNFLWGMALGRLEIPKWLAWMGAHGDCFVHTGKFDSRDDQRSIWFGYNKAKK